MIDESFQSFALSAIAVRVSDADESLREERRLLEDPDLTVLDAVIKAGLNESSPMIAILAAIAHMPEATGIFDEWVTYRWTLRRDEHVHARFFQSVEPMSLYPGDFTDKCFAHATPANLYDNQLWATCRNKPRRQPRLLALARGLVRRRAPSAAVVAAAAAAAVKKKERLALNGDDSKSGLRSADELRASLRVEYASATKALSDMRTKWTADTLAQKSAMAKVDAVKATLRFDEIVGHLTECKKSLVEEAACAGVKKGVMASARARFKRDSQALIDDIVGHIRRAEANGVADVELTTRRAACKAELAAARLAASSKKQEEDAIAAAVDWLKRMYTKHSRSLVRDTFDMVGLSARQMAHAMADLSPPERVHRMLVLVESQSVALVGAIDAIQYAQSSDSPAALVTHVNALIHADVLDYVNDALNGISGVQDRNRPGAREPAAVVSWVVAHLVKCRNKAGKRFDTLFSTSMQFVKTHIADVVLRDLDSIPLVPEAGTESASRTIDLSISEITKQVVPRVERALSVETNPELASPVAVLVDFLPLAAGSWRVDMALFSAFVKDHLEPAVNDVRARLLLPDAHQQQQQQQQATIWLGDAEQLCKAVVSPTFRRVFTATRYILQLQLQLPAAAAVPVP